MGSSVEDVLSRSVRKYERDHASYKYWLAEVNPEKPFLYDLTLFWQLLNTDDNFHMVYCPRIDFVEVGSVKDSPLLKMFDALLYVSRWATEPTSFMFSAWRGEESPYKIDQPNHMHSMFKGLREVQRIQLANVLKG